MGIFRNITYPVRDFMTVKIMYIQQQKSLDLLQALRAIAALLVVIDHSILTLIDKANFHQNYSQTAEFLGNLGVFIFFAISGFIMIHTNRKNLL